MIYLDNAATTWPKPSCVIESVTAAMRQYGANPGRSGHRLSMETAQMVFRCREKVAKFFGLSDPTGVVFTANCTTALNTVIHGMMRQGGRVLISDLEHNAVLRPCHALSSPSLRYDVARWSPSVEETVLNIRRAVTPRTRLIVVTHASNVFGVTMPIEKIAKVAQELGIPLCVDAAQTAGVMPIDMERMGIDYLCVAAHKGLYAPMGSGLLLCRRKEPLIPLITGGTGSYSQCPDQPMDLPDRLESGTLSVPSVAGIAAGIDFVQKIGRESIYEHEMRLLQQLYTALSECNGVVLYTDFPQIETHAPVLSVNVMGRRSEEVAALLDREGIAVRAGLHCAPMAHRHFNTLDGGTVRLAPSAFTDPSIVMRVKKVFEQFSEKPLHLSENVL